MDSTHKINPAEIQFIKPLDELMKTYQSTDKEYFCKLFERKKQLIENLMNIGIDSQKYFALLATVLKSDSPLKQFAKADLVQLKYQHEMNKETWFQQIVVQIQTSLTQQQNLYNQYKAPKKQPVHKVQQNVEQINPNIIMTQITNFKLFDELMQKYYETPYRQFFIDIYDKKHKMLQYIDSGKVSPQLYFEMSKKAFHDTKNEQVKKTLKDDFDNFELICDGDKKRWLKQSIKESKSADSAQKEIYSLHKKGETVNKRQFKPDVDLDQLMNVAIPLNTDLNDCISFVVLDRFMDQVKENPQIYIALFEKKQSMLAQVGEKKLNEKIYKQKLQKKIKSTKNQILKQIYESELNDILDIHEGNQKKWFQHLVEQSEIDLLMQQDIYNDLKLTYKPAPKKEKVQIRQQPKKQQTKKKNVSKSQQLSPLPFNPSKMFNLKVIEDAILMHENHTQSFIALISQKQNIIDMMKKGQLDAQKYRKMQQIMLKNFTDNQSVKEEIQMDLQGINDFHDGDINKWFEETVQRAGEYYETQIQKYQSLTKDEKFKDQITQQKKSPTKVQKKQQKPKSKPKIKQEIPQPFNIAKLCSLKVLDDALAEYANNEKLFIKLFAQKQKIIEMMQNGKLDALKYKKLQQKMMQEFKDIESIKDSISFELDDINDMHDGDVQKWFQEVVQNAGNTYEYQLQKYQKLLEKYKEQQETNEDQNIEYNKSTSGSKTQKPREQSNKKQFDSKLSEASSHINQTSAKSKIRYYLHEMAPYESLIKYFEKHDLNPNDNPMLKIYLRVPRHEIQQIIEKIKTDPNYDIVSYCEKFFPPISPSIFYQGAENYEQKFKKGIISCNKEIDSLKQYTKMLRKGLNTKNLQKVKERIQTCQQNIKYLTDLSGTIKNTKKLIPLPLIQEIHVSYPNIDQNTNLEPNEVEFRILKIQGLDGQQIMKVYFSGNKIKQLHIKNGSFNLNFKEKIPSAQNFVQLQKGDLKLFSISIYKIGWFSNTKLGQEPVEMMFIRSNIHEGKVQVGNATIYYDARVRKPKNPVLTEIKEIKITKYPPYEQSKQVQQEFIKKYTATK